MTAARQAGKRLPALLGLLALGLCSIGISPRSLAAAPEPIVVNSATGLAISGFDPVGYFTDGGPKTGRADLEFSFGGAVWRFINEGNKAAFAAHPDVYMPRFGGYDPVAIARDASVPGHPQVWAIVSDRLYLFYDEQARTAFIADPGRLIDTAERKWPEVMRTVGP